MFVTRKVNFLSHRKKFSIMLIDLYKKKLSMLVTIYGNHAYHAGLWPQVPSPDRCDYNRMFITINAIYKHHKCIYYLKWKSRYLFTIRFWVKNKFCQNLLGGINEMHSCLRNYAQQITLKMMHRLVTKFHWKVLYIGSAINKYLPNNFSTFSPLKIIIFTYHR